MRERFIKIQPNHSPFSRGEAGQHRQLILTEAFWKANDMTGTLGWPQGSRQWEPATHRLMCKLSELTQSLMEMNLDEVANQV